MNKIIVVTPLLVACHIPDLSQIKLSQCIDDCHNQLDGCGAADPCVENLQQCFDSADSCSNACMTCDSYGTCMLSDCEQSCEHLAHICTQEIGPCFQMSESDLVSQCLEPVLACVSGCVDTTQRQLGGS